MVVDFRSFTGRNWQNGKIAGAAGNRVLATVAFIYQNTSAFPSESVKFGVFRIYRLLVRHFYGSSCCKSDGAACSGPADAVSSLAFPAVGVTMDHGNSQPWSIVH